MHSHQRGRAGGVHRQSRPFQVQQIRNACRQDGCHVAHQRQRRITYPRRFQTPPVIASPGTDEDPASSTGQLAFAQRGIFQGKPGGFQKQPLLRVHQPRLARGDLEKQGVEQFGLLQKATHRVFASLLPTACRDSADAVPAGGYHVPVSIQVVTVAKATGHAYDRNRQPVSFDRKSGLGKQRLGISGTQPAFRHHREHRRPDTRSGGFRLGVWLGHLCQNPRWGIACPGCNKGE